LDLANTSDPSCLDLATMLGSRALGLVTMFDVRPKHGSRMASDPQLLGLTRFSDPSAGMAWLLDLKGLKHFLHS